MPATQTKSLRSAILLLNQAFVDHVKDEERRFDAITKGLEKLADIPAVLTSIETSMKDLKSDVIERLEKDMDAVKDRLTAIEHWRWGLMGAIPILTWLGLYVMKHVFSIQF